MSEPTTDVGAAPVASEAPAASVEKTAENGTKANANGNVAVDVKEEEKSTEPMLKTKARLDPKNHSSNRKFDPSVLPDTDDPEQIRTQVEFYFNDSNLPLDKHMWTLTGGPENKPVRLDEIYSFKRMRRFKPRSAVVAALRDSRALDISGADGEEVITRKKAYVSASENSQKRQAASVYVKGFGDEEPSTQFEVEAFFARYGPVNAIRLRRTEENLFKGSVFAEFQSEEQAKVFLALDPAPTWKGHELKIMSKKAYMAEKSKQIREGKIEPSSNKHKRFFEGEEGKGRTRSSDDWKKRRDQDQKNGFRDRRGRGGRGRGGRGRGGRGGRGGRDGRDGREKDDATDKDATDKDTTDKVVVKQEEGEDRPATTAAASSEHAAKASPAPDAAKTAEQPTNGKRAREDDGEGEPAAKKANIDS